MVYTHSAIRQAHRFFSYQINVKSIFMNASFMNMVAKDIVVLLRVAMGWLFFYAGITKVLDPEWSAAGYLANAKTFSDFFAYLASPANIGWVNLANEWGLTLLGISLLLGLGVRVSSMLGAALMMLYYLPLLEFPRVGAHSYIVDDHIVYALVLIFFAAVRAGRMFGLDAKIKKSPRIL